MQTQKRILSILALGLMFSGCQMVTSVVQTPLSKVLSSANQAPVVQVIGLWEPAEGVGTDNLPTRGFAGQLLFFAAGGTEPVRVAGDVQIFIFDDQGKLEDQTKPLHTFNFDKESFQAFLTETNLGYAYQLFVPYTRKESYNTTCSIRVVVTPENGRPVFSKMASVILPGPDAPPLAVKTDSRLSAVELASHETTAAATPPSQAELAAYFGSTTLPKPQSKKNNDRQRLHSTLAKVVQDSGAKVERVEQNPLLDRTVQRATHSTIESSPSNRHPLLTDD